MCYILGQLLQNAGVALFLPRKFNKLVHYVIKHQIGCLNYKKTLYYQNDIDFKHTSMNHKYELILKSSRMFHLSNLNIISEYN